MAVLASDGQKHAVIFGERVDLVADVQMAAGAASEGDPDASESGQTLFTLAFDPGNPLPIQDQLSNTNSSVEGCPRR